MSSAKISSDESATETTSLISTSGITAQPSSSDYGGMSFRSAFSSFEPSSSYNNDDQQQLVTPSYNQQDDGLFFRENNYGPANDVERERAVLINAPAPIHEPRTRSNSEHFHCHVGGDKDDASDDNEICAAIDAAKRQRTRRSRVSASTRRAIRALWISVAVCVIFMLCEVIGGVWAHSLAIITDAAHLLTDLASMLISLFSLYLGSRPASQRMSFGWYRAEVVGAFVSVFMIWVVTGVLVYLAIERIITAQYDIDAPVMAITAALGVFVNIIMGIFLYLGGHSHSHLGGGSHGHSHGGSHSRAAESSQAWHSSSELSHHSDTAPDNDDRVTLLSKDRQNDQTTSSNKIGRKQKKESTNINVRAAFIHVLGDLIQSVGVFLAALLILWKESLAVMDPICTLLFSVIVVSTTVYIIRDALVVLLEGRPSSIDFRHVFEALEQIEGVRKVHDLRIWALTMDRVAISVHLEITSNAHAQSILKNTTLMLRHDFNVYESTVQIEGWRPDSVNCSQCTVPER